MEAVVLVLLLALGVVGCLVAGFAGWVRTLSLARQVRELTGRLDALSRRVDALTTRASKAPPPTPAETPVERRTPPPVPAAAKPALSPVGDTSNRVPPPPASPTPAPPPAPTAWQPNLEILLGTKGVLWLGMLMVLIAVGLFLKYAYDNSLIDARGRLAIGIFTGVLGLGLGEYFRRQTWAALFQVFTGGGIAVFYICAFYAFQVDLWTQTAAFVLAIFITLGAVVLAVAHNAVAIAIVALVGGFMSPFLLSTGGNHPYVLFTYIAILDLVAVGAAYFRRWRALDLLCFVGTVITYAAWYTTYYHRADEPSQLVPALLFTTVFYLMFLLIPMLHSLVQRRPGQIEGLTLLAANALFSLLSYYNVLYHDYRIVLGFVVLGQAALVFGLFRAWTWRVTSDAKTASSLLIVSLALLTLAVPIQLRMYGIPLGWAAEGILFVYFGNRFNQTITKYAGCGSLLLAALGLVYRLPIHTVAFIPVFNTAFGSWILTAAAAGGAGYLLWRHRDQAPEIHDVLAPAVGLLCYVLVAAALSLETEAFWRVRGYWPRDGVATYNATHMFSSLVVLWALIASATLTSLYAKRRNAWYGLGLAAYGVATLVFLASLSETDLPSQLPLFNSMFMTRLTAPLALWWGGMVLRRARWRAAGDVLTVFGHFGLALLLAVEMVRWSDQATWISEKMGLSLISAAWALQALVLVWLGLARRNKARRVLGFVLFAITAAKVFLIDTAEVEPVFRIVSFLATGVLLLAAAYFYHRYGEKWLTDEQDAAGEDTP